MIPDQIQFALPDASWKVAETAMPGACKLVKYRTAQYQMLGYLDTSGRWVALDGLEEPMPVQSWREIIDPVSNWPERVA